MHGDLICPWFVEKNSLTFTLYGSRRSRGRVDDLTRLGEMVEIWLTFDPTCAKLTCRH